MSENSKIHLQRLKTGIAGAIIASVAIGNNPAVVQAESDIYEDQETNNIESVYNSTDTDSIISDELEPKIESIEEISQSNEKELDEAEEIQSELTEIENPGKNDEDIFTENETDDLELVTQEVNSNLSEATDDETVQYKEDNSKLEEATIKSITFDKDEYMYGEEATITLTVSSDVRIDYAEIELKQKYNSFENSTFLGFSDFIKINDGNYVATTQLYIEEELIGYEFVSGYYEKSNLEYSTFNNIPDFQSVNFIPNPETVGPEIKNIIFDKEEYEPGDIVKYEVHINHIRAVESFEFSVVGDKYSPNREYYDYVYNFTYDEVNNHYVGRGSFEIPENTIDDNYTIKNIYVSDINGNQTSYNEYDQNLNFDDSYFKVINTGVIDTDGPVVKDIIIGNDPYKRGEEIEITVIVSDESTIDYLELEFITNSNEFNSGLGSVGFHDFKVNNEGLYESTTTFRINDPDVEDFSQKSIYTFDYGQVFDIYGNQSDVYADEFPISIELYGEPDLEAPKIINITSDKETYAPGETAIVTVTVADESGIEYVNIKFAGDENNHREFSEYIQEFTKDSDGNFVGYAEITIPKMTIDEKYRIVEVEVQDSNWNLDYYYEDIDLSFEVIGSGVTDTKGPEIISIRSDKSSYKRGEEIEVSIVIDDDSPIDGISLEFYSNEGDYHDLSFYDFVVNSDGYYEGTITTRISDQYVYDFSKDSLYSLSYGEAYDIYGNKTGIDVEKFALSFELYGEPDLEAPKVVEIINDKEQFKPGDMVTFKVIVHDENEVESVSLLFTAQDYDQRQYDLWISEFEKDEDGNYVGYGELWIPENTIDAKYELVEVYTNDKLGNSNSFHNNLDSSFEVVGSGVTDTTGPEIINIESDKSIYHRGEEIEITVTLRDDNPIESLTLELESLHDYESFYLYDFKLNDEGYYVGTKTIRIFDKYLDNFNQSSEYTISSGYAEDLYGNRTDINPQDFSINFELYGESDLEAPELVDVILEEKEYSLGDKIQVTVTASDLTGVESASLEFELIDEDGSMVDTIYMYLKDFKYNPNSELYESINTHFVWNDISNGTYRLTYVELTDWGHNYQNYSISENNLTHNLTFTIQGLDDEAPVLEKVVIEGKQFLRGEEIEVTVNASDDSFISEVILFFETEDEIVTETVYLYEFEELVSGKYQAKGYFRINQADNVILRLHSAITMDEWGNTAEHDLSNLNEFITILPNEDIEGPNIHEIEIGQSEYMRGEDIEVSITVSDENAIYGVGLTFTSKDGINEEYLWIDEFEELDDGKFKGTGLFKLHEENTSWEFSHGIAFDEYYNHRDFDNQTLNESIHINENPDDEGPKVVSIETDKEFYSKGDKIKFTVTVTDENKAEFVYLEFGSEQVGGFIPFIIEDFQQVEGTNTYIGTIESTIPSYFFYLSPIKLIGVVTGDEYGNEKWTPYNYEHPELNDSIFDLVLHFGNENEDTTRKVFTETREEIVETFKVEYEENPDLLLGTEKTSRKGQNGVRTIVFEVTTIDGEEVSRRIISDSTTEVINQVIQVGTKAPEIEDITETVREETRTETISFETEIIYNPELLVGTERVTREGQVGVLELTEEVTYIGSEITNRNELSRKTLTDPISRIIEVGTKAIEIEDNATKVVTDLESGVKASFIGSDNRLNLVVKDVSQNFSNVPEILGLNYSLYDIYFVGTDGEEIKPTGMVQITIPYEEGLKPLRLYYFGDDFEVTEELEFEDTGDSISFNVNGFSYFGVEFDIVKAEDTSGSGKIPGIVLEVKAGELTDESGTETSSKELVVNTDSDSSKEDLPPTGETSMVFTQALGVLFTTLGAALGFKKKD